MNLDLAKALVGDTETYPNFHSFGLRRLSDGKYRVFEHSTRKQLTEAEIEAIRAIMVQNSIVGYNFIGYDNPMLAVLLDGADNTRMKQSNDRIIVGKMRHWHSEEVLGVSVPRSWKTIDLMEVQPNAFAGLKTLMGRMHAKKLQDLPYSPDTALTHEQMDNVLSYMGNDLEGTQMLFEALKEPLALRETIGAEYDIDLMSKSDPQMGEAIIKKRVEQARGERVWKVDTPAGTTFKYPVPEYLSFDREDLRAMLERLRNHDFMVQGNGKVELPEWMAVKAVKKTANFEDGSSFEHDSIERPAGGQFTIDGTTYQMGIGGLHSAESNRSVHSDDDTVLLDFDVASYYPAIILNSGLYPKALGPAFLTEYRKIRDERVAAKRAGDKTKAEGLKIALNGCFGKLGSPYSVLYAPHLMIAVTLTGQLALLMLIERASRAGFPAVSGNTDGVVFHCPRDREDELLEVTKQWEIDTGFELEQTRYRSLYSRSVNDYIAIKEGGAVKWKGVIANPWRSDAGFKPDIRAQLMKNPQMPIMANAVVDLILHGTPLEETIRASRDVRDFVTVVKVDGGATWRGEYLGKVVRYIWAVDGEEILRAKGHATTGTHGKVPKSDGCRPLMELPAEFPEDIDYQAYIRAAEEILMDIGYNDRPPPVKPIRLYKWSAIAWFALAV